MRKEGQGRGMRDEWLDRMEEGRGRRYSTCECGGVREEGEWIREKSLFIPNIKNACAKNIYM